MIGLHRAFYWTSTRTRGGARKKRKQNAAVDIFLFMRWTSLYQHFYCSCYARPFYIVDRSTKNPEVNIRKLRYSQDTRILYIGIVYIYPVCKYKHNARFYLANLLLRAIGIECFMRNTDCYSLLFVCLEKYLWLKHYYTHG